MGKHKRNKKKKKRNSRNNAQYDQASPHTEARGPNAKGKKRELSPYNNGQPRGTGNDSNAQRGEINTRRSDGTRSTSHEEGGPKRQKRVNENEQSAERTIGQTYNAETSQLGNFSDSNQVRLNASRSSETFAKSLLTAGQYQVLQFLLYIVELIHGS
ncbi:Hypothetical predicted protein [Paramuricea clavata]|uniref:Uncharacterized protein n=1 Tax=Paramuricea clavata TaxID=317549 RepID=A0A6S7KE75_PARCT|nr:Hypothetical predicted protein [Paramuricea clavata]